MKPFHADRSEQLLELLLRRHPEIKRSRVLQVLKHGSVRVNGRVVTLHRHPVKAGDAIDFLSVSQASARRFGNRMRLSVLHEDESILVVEKPEGLLTISTESEREKTLYAQLTEYVRLGGGRRDFIVHRLDRETSGVLVFAKTEAAKNFLQSHWEETVKKYIALTVGVPKKKEGRIEGHLREDESRRVWVSKHAVQDSRPATTRYRVLSEKDGYALLEIFLETGRKNQIRAHLASIGCPVAGDKKFGAEDNPIGRVALHASELTFPHPDSGKPLTFRSAPPPDFKFYR